MPKLTSRKNSRAKEKGPKTGRNKRSYGNEPNPAQEANTHGSSQVPAQQTHRAELDACANDLFIDPRDSIDSRILADLERSEQAWNALYVPCDSLATADPASMMVAEAARTGCRSGDSPPKQSHALVPVLNLSMNSPREPLDASSDESESSRYDSAYEQKFPAWSISPADPVDPAAVEATSDSYGAAEPRYGAAGATRRAAEGTTGAVEATRRATGTVCGPAQSSSSTNFHANVPAIASTDPKRQFMTHSEPYEAAYGPLVPVQNTYPYNLDGPVQLETWCDYRSLLASLSENIEDYTGDRYDLVPVGTESSDESTGSEDPTGMLTYSFQQDVPNSNVPATVPMEQGFPTNASDGEASMSNVFGKRQHVSPQDGTSSRKTLKKSRITNRNSPHVETIYVDDSPQLMEQDAEDEHQGYVPWEQTNDVWITSSMLERALQPIHDTLEVGKAADDALFEHVQEFLVWKDSLADLDIDNLKKDMTEMTLQSMNTFHEISRNNFDEWKQKFHLEVMNMLSFEKGDHGISDSLRRVWTNQSRQIETIQLACQAYEGRFVECDKHIVLVEQRLGDQVQQIAHMANIVKDFEYHPLRHWSGDVPDKETIEKVVYASLEKYQIASRRDLLQHADWVSGEFKKLGYQRADDLGLKTHWRKTSPWKKGEDPCRMADLVPLTTNMEALQTRLTMLESKVQGGTTPCTACTALENKLEKLRGDFVQLYTAMEGVKASESAIIADLRRKNNAMERILQKHHVVLERLMSVDRPAQVEKKTMTAPLAKPEKELMSRRRWSGFSDPNPFKPPPPHRHFTDTEAKGSSPSAKRRLSLPDRTTEMPKNERGKILSKQHHEGPNVHMGLPQPCKKVVPSSDDSDSDRDHKAKGSKPDAYATKELCRDLIGIPYWDGKAFTWKAFMKEWRAYWEFQRGLVGPKAKKWIFIRCLPHKWKEHMKAHITDADWSYTDIVNFLEYQNNLMVPDWKKENLWREFYPKGCTYMDFIHWWLSWRRIGAECGTLRDVDWNHQFNVCMNHHGYFTKHLEELIEHELCEQTTWDVERRYTFIANKLMIAFKAQEVLRSTFPNEGGQKRLHCGTCLQEGHSTSQCPRAVAARNTACFKCGKQGHFANECPQTRGEISKGFVHQPRYGEQQNKGEKPPEKVGHQPAHGKQKGASGGPRDPQPMSGKGRGKGPGRGYNTSSNERAISRDKIQRRKDHGLCLHCAQPGHQAWECPVKKSLSDRKGATQRNVHAKGHEKGRGRGKGRGKGPHGGKKGGRGQIREIAAEDDEDAYGVYDEYEDYDYGEDEGDVLPKGTAPPTTV